MLKTPTSKEGRGRRGAKGSLRSRSGLDLQVVSEKIRQGIQLVQERFGPNSVERAAVKDYNFRQLDNLLLPPYSRFLLWLSVQDETFFDEASGVAAKPGDVPDKKKPLAVVKKDTLWPTLISDLALTYEQDEKLKALYKYVLGLDACGLHARTPLA